MAQPAGEESFKVTDRRRRGDEESGAPASAPDPRAEPSLTGLFTMLASEAVIALGEVPDPATGKHERDLGHATQVIDLLMLLRDKTDGHRTAQESAVLEGLLYDLQLRFVNARKQAG